MDPEDMFEGLDLVDLEAHLAARGPELVISRGLVGRLSSDIASGEPLMFGTTLGHVIIAIMQLEAKTLQS